MVKGVYYKKYEWMIRLYQTSNRFITDYISTAIFRLSSALDLDFKMKIQIWFRWLWWIRIWIQHRSRWFQWIELEILTDFLFEIWKSVHWFKSYRPFKLDTFCPDIQIFGQFSLKKIGVTLSNQPKIMIFEQKKWTQW